LNLLPLAALALLLLLHTCAAVQTPLIEMLLVLLLVLVVVLLLVPLLCWPLCRALPACWSCA
jgi:hypothetical protein